AGLGYCRHSDAADRRLAWKDGGCRLLRRRVATRAAPRRVTLLGVRAVSARRNAWTSTSMNEDFATRIKRLVIRAMFSHARLSSRLVLKGGNLLDLVFEISARSSIDVDFSISDEFESVELLRAAAAAALHTVFAQEGFEVFDVTVDERPAVLTENMRPF